MLLLALLAIGSPPVAPAAEPVANGSAAASVSRDARRTYARAKPSLFQVRVLTAAGRSQSSAGSGFMIGADGLAITNYHVVARLALEPTRYVGEAVGTGGDTDELVVLKIDVLNDLALVRLKTRRDWPALPVRKSPLAQGERLYSLGNPLDLGFAISEGAFNGELARPYHPQLLFSGAINPGMSGGPALDEAGLVVGVNVAKRLDGEQISFLVPARFIGPLLDAAATRAAQPDEAAFRQDIVQQLTGHQRLMLERLLGAPLQTRAMGPYQAPVNEAPGIRCWGTNPDQPELKYQLNRLACRTESTPFIEDRLRTGYINVRHEFIESSRLDAFRFLRLYSGAYQNEVFGSFRDRHWTGPECHDAFVRAATEGRPPLRAVVCVRALRKFAGLYDFALMMATVDDSKRGLQTRVDASGVTLDTGQQVVKAFIDAVSRQAGP